MVLKRHPLDLMVFNGSQPLVKRSIDDKPSVLPCFMTPWQSTFECRKTFRMMDDDEVPLAFQVQHLLCSPFLPRRIKLYLSSKLWKLWLFRCGINTKDTRRVTKKDLAWSVTTFDILDSGWLYQQKLRRMEFVTSGTNVTCVKYFSGAGQIFKNLREKLPIPWVVTK